MRLDASRFISANVACYPAALSHLRHLEIVFPDLGLKEPPPQHEKRAWDSLCRDWRAAVRCLRQERGRVRQAGLTIVVHMGIIKVRSIQLCFLSVRRDLEMHIQGKLAFARKLVADSTNGICTDADLVRGHADLLNPLRQLRDAGLERLHIFLDSNWHYLSPIMVHAHRAAIKDTIVAIEQTLEGGVMGNAYHSKVEGRTEKSPSKRMVARRPVFISHKTFVRHTAGSETLIFLDL
ncbi:hypothetical protein PG999_003647 [Apiospora kogelbergensis]|uniref:Uncharacterized protein n=1 Tax=Apiospora kogelbergensis TaxID=1337665 RepID=A0AAW0R4D2_9PEZI